MFSGGTAYRRPHTARGTRALPLVAANSRLNKWLLALLLLAAGYATAETNTSVTTFRTATELLEQVRETLPKETIQLRGELLCGAARGKLDRSAYLEGQLQLGQAPATAQWTLQDAFGAPTEQLTLRLEHDGIWRRDYAKGRPLQRTAAPPGESPIGGSDVTWNDLSLAFLWWTNGVITGAERLLERDCLVLEFTAAEAPRLTRAWIDEKLLLLLKLEEYDEREILQRRLSVRTLKKIGETWLVKDLDIRRFPGNHRTLIRLNEVNAVSE